MNDSTLQLVKNSATKLYPFLDNVGLLGYIDIVALVDALGILGRDCFEEWYGKFSKEENKQKSIGMRLAIVDSMDLMQLELIQEKEEEDYVSARISERINAERRVARIE